MLDAFKDLGFHFASQAGITISKNDVVIPPTKEKILERYEGEVGEILDQYDTGLISQEERHEAVVEKWNAATDEVGQAMQDNLHELNPIFMMANSGARGSFKQIRQLAGMRGLMANPKGEIIERPIKANFMEGLTVLEYFISTHGARKGLADTALRTADSGYLTRRLVDVAQDVIVRQEDCGTKRVHRDADARATTGGPTRNLLGRFTAEEVKTKRSRSLLPKDHLVTKQDIEVLAEGLEEDDAIVPMRSVLKCEADTGSASTATAWPRPPASWWPSATRWASSRPSRSASRARSSRCARSTPAVSPGLDITQGLPRVVELFEARKPKGLAKLAEEDGKASIERTEKALKVVVTDDAGEENSYSFPVRMRLFVEDGQKIKAGDQLNEGSIYPHELLDIRGRTDTEVYLVQEVQKVYRSQGVDIQDKHIEIIVRQMLKKVRIDQKGDSTYLPGAFIDRFEAAASNAALKKAKKEQAQFEPIILGITKASLATDSFLSAASFQETTKVLTDAALEGKTDKLLGLKENVIIGKLIPAATGLKRYRRLEIEPTEPIRRHTPEEIGLLDENELAAELGLTEDGELEGFGFGESDGGNGGGGSFGDELADLPAPADGDDK